MLKSDKLVTKSYKKWQPIDKKDTNYWKQWQTSEKSVKMLQTSEIKTKKKKI